jgi:dihydrofolate reductase
MIKCIVAVDQGQGIGFNGSMPWPTLKEDLSWFKEKTLDHIVLMGSNTYRSLGKNLSNRINIVISSQLNPKADFTFTNPIDAIETLKERYNKEIYIIGGQKIYDNLQELVDVFYITEIDYRYKCDTFFNLDYVKKNFKNVEEIKKVESTETTPAYTIKEYTK